MLRTFKIPSADRPRIERLAKQLGSPCKCGSTYDDGSKRRWFNCEIESSDDRMLGLMVMIGYADLRP